MDSLQPMVLPVTARTADRRGNVDIYLPDDISRPRPAVLIVHGGPTPAEARPRPRDWPIYQAYGSLLAGQGVVAATVDHRLHSPVAYPTAAGDVEAAVELLRADPAVDGDRLALWFFSGGGPLCAGWLRDPAPWLRCVALTYPLLAPFPGWPEDPRFLPADAVAHAAGLPIVLTRVGLENPTIAEGVQAFVEAAAKARLEIIDVPLGHHGFDYLDDDDTSRAAITRAADLVLATLS